MSKAILVLEEMPEACFGCGLCEQVDDTFMSPFYCAVYGETFDGIKEIQKGKPEWCPLRDLPERKETDNMAVIMHDAEAANRSTLQQIGYNRGWNDCLDRLEGKYEQPETVG